MTISPSGLVACLSMLLLHPVGALCQWVQQPFPSLEALWKVRFVDSTTGWILGQNYIYKTSDGGSSWMAQDSSIGAGFALTALDGDTVFYANFTGVAPYTRGLRRTTNGGADWSTVDTATLLWNEVRFVDHNIGYAAGGTVPNQHPIVRKTIDGGASWYSSWIGSGSYDIEGMYFFNADHGWIATYDAVILETTDGGTNWMVRDSVRFQPSGSWLPIRDITFASPDSGWAVGGLSGQSLVVRTTDAGLHWEIQTFQGSSLREVKFFDNKLGWFAGAFNGDPFIARTSDGGETWVTQYQIPHSISGVESFSMVDTNLGWTVNNARQVYKTTNGGLTSAFQSEAELSYEFALYQNYPNPFNSSTTIRFRLPRSSKVTLKVIDVLGREIATLVSATLEAGTYAENWNVGDNASGVYFYKLVATDFAIVNRMILIK